MNKPAQHASVSAKMPQALKIVPPVKAANPKLKVSNGGARSLGSVMNSVHKNILNSTRKHGGRRRTYKGGLAPLSPMEISGIENTSGADIQLMATNY
jgi:hypothetical protein